MALKWRIFHLLTFYLYGTLTFTTANEAKLSLNQNCGVETDFYIIKKLRLFQNQLINIIENIRKTTIKIIR